MTMMWLELAVYFVLFAIAYQLMDAWQVSAAGCLRGMQDTKGTNVDYHDRVLDYCLPCGHLSCSLYHDRCAGVWIGLIVV